MLFLCVCQVYLYAVALKHRVAFHCNTILRKICALALKNLLPCSGNCKAFILCWGSALSVYCVASILPRRFWLNIAPLGCDMVLEPGLYVNLFSRILTWEYFCRGWRGSAEDCMQHRLYLMFWKVCTLKESLSEMGLFPGRSALYCPVIFDVFCCFAPAVDVKSEVPVGLEPISPLDLRTDLRMMVPMVDPIMREKQLQQELLLIQQQQQIQKQLLIAEFQKQHENLTRQHQAQLQEHIKVATFFIYPLLYLQNEHA